MRFPAAIIVAFASLACAAQERLEVADSTRIGSHAEWNAAPALAPSQISLYKLESMPLQLTAPAPMPSLSLGAMLNIPFYIDHTPLNKGDFATSGIYNLPVGNVYGFGEQTSLPGIGRYNSASLGYAFPIGSKISMSLQVNAMKLNMPFAHGDAFGVSGRFTYQATSSLYFNVFGSYYKKPYPGLMQTGYGASMGIRLNDRLSLEMGAQRRRDPVTGKWETVPMFIPSFRFDKVSLGLDIGSILYEILRSNNDYYRGNPTIAPTRPEIPIAPR